MAATAKKNMFAATSTPTPLKVIIRSSSERHLHRYLSEFDFRYSNRIRLGVDDVQRTERAIKGIVHLSNG
jgi:hypothetical protein